MERNARKTDLDALRILACLFVIYNHAAGQVMRLTEGASGAAALGLLYYSKPSIPLFLMVTGAVLLGRVDSYRRMGQRLVRIVAALVLFSLAYYAADCLTNGEVFALGTFFDRLYHTNMTNSLWYLYAYAGVLIMMPFLQRMSMGMGAADYRYAIFWIVGFVGVFTILQCISTVFVYDSGFELPLFGGVVGSILMGRYMECFVKPRRAYTIIALVVPAAIALAETIITLRDPSRFALLDNSFQFPALFGALCLFYLVKRLDERLRLSERTCARISGLAKLTFCMYLVSDFVVLRLRTLWEALVPVLRVNGAGAVYMLAVLAACTLLALILTRIPGLKRIL